MPSLIQKHAHVKGQRSNHHIFKFQPNPSWAKKRPNRYTSFQYRILQLIELRVYEITPPPTLFSVSDLSLRKTSKSSIAIDHLK